jgi:membrane-associated phospholipid phosphatase
MRLLTLFSLALMAGFAVDAPVALAVRNAPEWLSTAGARVTWIGQTDWQAIILITLMVVYALARPDPRSAARAQRLLQVTTACFLLILLTGIAVQVLKHGFGRPRPGALSELSPYILAPFGFQSGWNSFPSGHSTTMGALAVLAAHLWPRGKWIAIAFALFVGASRVIVAKHFPSDVIAGLGLGAVLSIWMLNRWQAAGAVPRAPRPLRQPKIGFGPASGLLEISRSFGHQLAALFRSP